ncbi:MAG: DNA integrity scanning diadenylate cyclase DisA [Clostridia bacterium]|nr:DNA integrity scanning diadenylate cyclase DisA [Clostridia bacterium]
MREERLKKDEVLDILKMMAPGTPLREGLENILRARTGALIVIGDSSQVIDAVDGGFNINKEYSPSHLYELAKMDGAIILSKDLKKILLANALLIPDSTIPTEETGTRHKTAERFARQTGETVICISQRRNIITLYINSRKYILKDTPTILTRANQALQTLEKYKAVLDSAMNNLSVLEFDDIVTLDDVAFVIQRTEMVMRIVTEIDRYIIELGNEGRLVSMQLEELLANIEQDGLLVIEDYMLFAESKLPEEVLKEISSFTYSELSNLPTICKALGYYSGINTYEINITPRGHRLMNKLPRVSGAVVKKLISQFSSLQGVLRASVQDLDNVEGIGEVRARMIKEGLRKIQEQLLLDSRRI